MSSAMGNKGEPPEMSEAHLLAPWYIAGKLDEDEARQIEELAKEDPEFALLLKEASREAEASVSLNEALEGPPRAVWERLERTIEDESRARSQARWSGFLLSAKNSVSGFTAGFTKPQWQLAAAAALAICIVQAGTIIYLTQGGGTAKYTTASGPKTEARTKSSAFIVSFSDKATIGEISALLDDAGAIIVEGPNSDMIYRLALRSDNVAGKDEAFKKLRSSAVVKLVLPEK
jgi:anti-sigma-K factor RskA